MLILLAESKTMSTDQIQVCQETFESNKPIFEGLADSLMEHVSTLTPTEVSEILGISNSLASKAISFAYDFPNKTMGYKALFAFTGDAYRGLEASSLNEGSISRSKSQLRIISSAYGILSPENIIKPYRLDFNKPISIQGETPVKTFKSKVTIDLVRYIKDNSFKEIINLLPAEAEACIDWKILRAFSKVYKITFKTIDSDGKLHTPLAKYLKELRGRMARTILQQNIDNFKALTVFDSLHFIYSAADSKPGLPVFIVAQH